MRKLSHGQAIASILATLLSYALAVAQFIMAARMLIDLRMVISGLAAWAGLFSLIFLAIGALALVMAMPSYFWEGSRKGKFRLRFFKVLAIQCYLYPVLLLLTNIEFSFLLATKWDLVIGGAGLALGTLFTILAVQASKSLRT